MWQRKDRPGYEITYLLVTEVSQWCANDHRQSTVFWKIILTRWSKTSEWAHEFCRNVFNEDETENHFSIDFNRTGRLFVTTAITFSWPSDTTWVYLCIYFCDVEATSIVFTAYDYPVLIYICEFLFYFCCPLNTKLFIIACLLTSRWKKCYMKSYCYLRVFHFGCVLVFNTSGNKQQLNVWICF